MRRGRQLRDYEQSINLPRRSLDQDKVDEDKVDGNAEDEAPGEENGIDYRQR